MVPFILAEALTESTYTQQLTTQYVANHPLTCDYTHDSKVTVAEKIVRVKATDNIIQDPLIFTDFYEGTSLGFSVKNTTPYDINATIHYVRIYDNPRNAVMYQGTFPDSETVLIRANDKYTKGWTPGLGIPPIGRMDQTGMSYDTFENDYLTASNIMSFVVTVPECDICSGGKVCLNDSVGCSSSNECGGKYCVENLCSKSELCPGSPPYCKCVEKNKLQCTDNKRCVEKGVVALGNIPSCGMTEECVSGGYFDGTICTETLEAKAQRLAKEEAARIAAEKAAADAKAAADKAAADKITKDNEKFWQGMQFNLIIIVAAIIVIFMLIFARPRGPVYEAVTFWRRI